MAKTLKILCVHGLGDHRETPWQSEWEAAVRQSFPADSSIDLQFRFLTYDHIFEKTNISALESMRAVWKLIGSGVGSLFRAGRRGLLTDVDDWIRWSAGYVVAWLEDEGFQRQTRRLVLDAFAAEKPDLILAHSLGSLVTYNAFTHEDATSPDIRSSLSKVTHITFGSQLGNRFVIGNLTPGRLEALPVKWWYHLYNKHDHVFTAPVRLWNADNFTMIDTTFDRPNDPLNHNPCWYLSNDSTRRQIWLPLADTVGPKSVPLGRALVRPPRHERQPRRRALLVGINDYPDPAARLEGCVNDVFCMSAVLQESGYSAEDIRVCLDRRATAAGICERLEWLLDTPRAGDQLVFYYSGHGAQLPTYGEGDQVDHKDESLVPYDFDWTPETSITDDQIWHYYSQLPYETQLVMIFDCCHSGGIHRSGANRIRGIDPPDDIRHRELRWNPEREIWEPRDLNPVNRAFSRQAGVNRLWFGERGDTVRLGRAAGLRTLSAAQYDRLKRRNPQEPVGPYLPMILEACGEQEYAYEYRHGVTSYGAFTYSLTTILRRHRHRRQPITFQQLVEHTAEQLRYLNYQQTPHVLGPSALITAPVPWRDAPKPSARKTPSRKRAR